MKKLIIYMLICVSIIMSVYAIECIPTINPSNNGVVNYSAPIITFNYSDCGNQSLRVMSGDTFVKQYSVPADYFIWQPTFFQPNTHYMFELYANNSQGNMTVTPYNITTTVNETIEFEVFRLKIKSDFMKLNNVSYHKTIYSNSTIYVNYTVQGYWNQTTPYVYFRQKHGDFIGMQNFKLGNTATFTLYCEEDYNVSGMNMLSNLTRGQYNVTYNYDYNQSGLNCTDKYIGPAFTYNLVLEIKLPEDILNDTYNISLNLSGYNTVMED